MLKLLGLNGGSRQWRNAKEAAKNGEVLDISIAKQPKKTEAAKLSIATDFISNFALKVCQNFRPVDTKNGSDLKASEVIIPFESVVQFYR